MTKRLYKNSKIAWLSQEKGVGGESVHDYPLVGFKSFNVEEKQAA